MVVMVLGSVFARADGDPGDRTRAARTLARVDSLLAAGNLEEGRRLAQEACDRHAGDPRLLDPLENRLALALMGLDRHAEALPLLENALRRRPGDGDAHRNLGACLLAMGRKGRALSEYQQWVQADPLNYLARLEYGQVLYEFRLLEDSERELRLAAELCGGCGQVDPALAATLLAAGKPAAALDPLRRLLAGPEGESHRRSYLKALLDSGEDAELIAFLTGADRALTGQEARLLVEAEGRLGRGRWSAWLLAWATEQNDRPDLALAPGWGDDPLLWARISLNLQQLDRREEALAAVDRAIALDPASALLRNNRVVLLQELGREQEARREWERVLELDPSLERNGQR